MIYSKDHSILKFNHRRYEGCRDERPSSYNSVRSFNALCYAVYSGFDELAELLFERQGEWTNDVPVRLQLLAVSDGSTEY